MPEEKVFYPETAPENPFPGQDVPVVVAEARPPIGTYTPTTTPTKPFPKKRVATELISTALNTRSRRILAEFEFTPSGALQIGDYKKGTSGDLRISPNGLTARDKAGITTFSIDGTTGDAIFKGTVQAGSVIAGAIISGDITVGGSGNSEGEIHVLDSTDVEKVTIDKDGIVISSGKLTIKDSAETTIIDATGLVSTANFIFGTQSPANQQPTGTGSTNWIDIPGTSQTISLSRTANVLVLSTALVNMVNLAVTGKFRMNVGGDVGGPIAVFGVIQSGSGQSTETLWDIVQLNSGDNTFKLQCAADSGQDMVFQGMEKAYIILGK